MSNGNNARASFFGIGGSITVRFDVADLAVKDRLALLHSLMQSTGTTEAIRSMPNGEQIFEAIQAAWEKVS